MAVNTTTAPWQNSGNGPWVMFTVGTIPVTITVALTEIDVLSLTSVTVKVIVFKPTSAHVKVSS